MVFLCLSFLQGLVSVKLSKLSFLNKFLWNLQISLFLILSVSVLIIPIFLKICSFLTCLVHGIFSICCLESFLDLERSCNHYHKRSQICHTSSALLMSCSSLFLETYFVILMHLPSYLTTKIKFLHLLDSDISNLKLTPLTVFADNHTVRLLVVNDQSFFLAT